MAKRERMSHKKQEKVDQKHAVRRSEPQTLFDRHAWEQSPVSIAETPFRPPIGAHVELLARAPSDEHRAHLALHLQRTYGNRYVQRLLNSRVVQAKLTVSAPNDIYEQEADRVANAVTRAANSQVQRQAAEEEELQMKPAFQVQRQEEGEEEEEEVQPQLAGSQPATVSRNLETRIKAARGGGHPLSDTVREPMEQAFGADFSNVRVHTDSEADALNQQLSARAFTTGQDVFFSEGKYSPGSDSGRGLIAHELTHVVQQSTGKVGGGGSGMTVRPVGDAFEREADDLASHVVRRLRAPEGTHVAKTSRYATPVRAVRSGQIQRWAEQEHEAMGDGAWKIEEPKIDAFVDRRQKDLKPVLGKLGPVNFGRLTQLGGDYSATVEELKKTGIKKEHIEIGWGGIGDAVYYYTPGIRPLQRRRGAAFKKMCSIAETNVEHFSPLAQGQYVKYHKQAIKLASEAYLDRTNKKIDHKTADNKFTQDALVTEGFAAHFLQDSYASGHQAVRALDEIPEFIKPYKKKKRTGKTQLGIRMETKNYHDRLCQMEVPILGPAAGKYFGDNKQTPAQKAILAEETAKSLHEVFVAYWPELEEGEPAAPSKGPDMGAINKEMSEGSDLGIMWQRMLKHYLPGAKAVEKKARSLEKKKAKIPKAMEKIRIPKTGVEYTREQILEYYKYISGKQKNVPGFIAALQPPTGEITEFPIGGELEEEGKITGFPIGGEFEEEEGKITSFPIGGAERRWRRGKKPSFSFK